MADGKIRWKQSDYLKLGKAVADFNRKIKKLETEENKNYFPEIQNYKELKGTIETRAELNRQIKNMRKFLKEGAEELYTTEAGEEITKWENQLLKREKRTIEKRLNKELESLNEPTESGYSKAQMGFSRINEIENSLRGLQKLEKAAGESFNRLKGRIHFQGRSDYLTKKQRVFRENYMEMLKNFKGYEWYKEYKQKLESFSGNKEFCDYVLSHEKLGDMQYMYDTKDGILVPKAMSTDDFFTKVLEDEGILGELEEIREQNKMYSRVSRKRNNLRVTKKQKYLYE